MITGPWRQKAWLCSFNKQAHCTSAVHGEVTALSRCKKTYFNTKYFAQRTQDMTGVHWTTALTCITLLYLETLNSHFLPAQLSYAHSDSLLCCILACDSHMVIAVHSSYGTGTEQSQQEVLTQIQTDHKICKKIQGNRFHSSKRICHRLAQSTNIWQMSANSATQTMKRDWSLLTGTFMGWMREKHTVLSFWLVVQLGLSSEDMWNLRITCFLC